MKYLVETICILLIGCVQKDTFEMKLVDKNKTGITFRNDLTFSNDFNVYKYRNYYNGGGVAIGDINNDGFADIYFSSNQSRNELYIGKGNFNFINISNTSGTDGTRAWSTGVSMADVNADGLLDIYVCNSGDIEGDNKENELFINNGDLTFTEEGKKYGLDDPGYSTHASFFDYDRDGDLDVYLLNNSYQAIGSFDLRRNERPNRDALGGDKLLKNENGRFIDVSEAAGIYGSIIGFGLGVTIGDLNGDAWDDIYISNDFFERDYLYINNQDGSFDEVFTEWVQSTSGASMGADMADIDNDGFNDLFVTEMLPRDDKRLKSVTTFEDWDRYQYSVKNSYHHQFTRNTFQINTGNKSFVELGRYSNVEATDWSWGALMFDMNNDGLRDIFVANGIYKDLTDQDYLQYISNSEVIKSIVSNNKVDYKRLVELIPSRPIPNYAFLNLGDYQFLEMGKKTGLDYKGFSNGAAYGDLDNDGDLDLVVNNVNDKALIYENKLKGGNHIQIITKGKAKNPFGYGTKIHLKGAENTYYIEQQPARGFQSSMDQKLTVGLVSDELLDIEIVWPTGGVQKLMKVAVNQLVTLIEKDTLPQKIITSLTRKQLLKPLVFDTTVSHIENEFIDFNRDRLLYHMRSTDGPMMASYASKNVLNLFVGASKNNYPYLLKVNSNSTLGSQLLKTPNEKSTPEDGQSVFFDADGDGDIDLYVTSGGVEVSENSSALIDRLYLNNGDGSYSLSDQRLPVHHQYVSTSAVDFSDIDLDGDYDLFVGEYAKPLKYGLPGNGYLLINDGKGNFSDKTRQLAPSFSKIGMINDAKFQDFNSDGYEDLVVVGNYTSILIFENYNGSFKLTGNLKDLQGWWKTVHLTDIDLDGDIDLFVGNHGLNSRFKASEKNPILLYVNDFDKNGFIDPILTKWKDNKSIPYALRHNLIDQIKSLKKKYPDYNSYKNAHIEDMFPKDVLKQSVILQCNTLESILLINEGNFTFSRAELPKEAQFSPIYAASSGDYDRDGDIDLIVGGNLYGTKPEVGRYDSNTGLILKNNGDNQFTTSKYGLGIKGQVRDIISTDTLVIIARNNESILFYSY